MTNEYGTWQVNEAAPKAEAEDTEENEDWYEEDDTVGAEAQAEEQAAVQTLDQPHLTNRERIYRAIESHGPLKATAAFEMAGIAGTQGYGILRTLETSGLIKREVDEEGTTRFSKGLDWNAVSHTRGRKPGSTSKAKPVAAKRNATKPKATVKQAVGTPTIVGMALVFSGEEMQTFWRGSDGKTYRVEEVESVTL